MYQVFSSAFIFLNLNFVLSKRNYKEDCYQYGFDVIGSHLWYTQQNVLIAAYLFKHITRRNWSCRTCFFKCGKRQLFFNMFSSGGVREVIFLSGLEITHMFYFPICLRAWVGICSAGESVVAYWAAIRTA